MQKALESLPGVTNVAVDVSSKTATCTVEDPDNFDADAAIAALEAAGYPNSKVH